MRVKYATRGIVLARSHVGEATTFVTLITPDLGLVHARAQSLRKPGAKLAAAIATFAESSVVLVRGKEGWRVAGAVLEENWFGRVSDTSARRSAARVSGLLLRLVAGEAHDPELFPIMRGFLEALATLSGDSRDAVEIVAVLRILAALGLDTGDIASDTALFAPPTLAMVLEKRSDYVTRINTGIAASGL